MKFHVLTLFPEMFAGIISQGVVGRAVERGTLQVELHNIRDYATDRHRTVDDTPYGGGAGMVMKVEPLVACIEAVQRRAPAARLLLTSPAGRPFDQALATEFAADAELIVLCGRYEGIDERVRQICRATEISIGDYVLSGGEIAAMVLIDAVGRLVPGVLGSDESAVEESFANGLLEYPQYTRPPEFRGLTVPEVLLSGNHRQIASWRRCQSLRKTRAIRPALLERLELDAADLACLQGAGEEKR